MKLYRRLKNSIIIDIAKCDDKNNMEYNNIGDWENTCNRADALSSNKR
jgi:hypothetical protein